MPVCLDDILVTGKTKSEYLLNLQEVHPATNRLAERAVYIH